MHKTPKDPVRFVLSLVHFSRKNRNWHMIWGEILFWVSTAFMGEVKDSIESHFIKQ